MILIAVRDLMFASKIDAAAKRMAAEIAWAPRGVPLSRAALERPPRLLLADLGQPGILDELRAVRAGAPGVRIVGFLGHLEEGLMAEARSVGVEEVLTRGQLAAQLDRVLAEGAGAGPAAGGA
jgi:hypothetical protein